MSAFEPSGDARLTAGQNCAPLVPRNQVQVTPWDPATLIGTRVMDVTMGLTGGDRGYTAITGKLQQIKVITRLCILILFHSSLLMTFYCPVSNTVFPHCLPSNLILILTI